jgi:integrase
MGTGDHAVLPFYAGARIAKTVGLDVDDVQLSTRKGACASTARRPGSPRLSIHADEKVTAHVLRHTFATSLVCGGTDLVTVAELLGHARLETVRVYTQPTEEDKIRALSHLIVDE